MRFSKLIMLLTLSLASNVVEAEVAIQVTYKTYETEKKIIRLSTGDTLPPGPENVKNWKIEKNRFNKIVADFFQLPGTTDNLLKCPRNYIQFDYSNGKMKRREFVCYEKTNSTRKKYIAFSKIII